MELGESFCFFLQNFLGIIIIIEDEITWETLQVLFRLLSARKREEPLKKSATIKWYWPRNRWLRRQLFAFHVCQMIFQCFQQTARCLREERRWRSLRSLFEFDLVSFEWVESRIMRVWYPVPCTYFVIFVNSLDIHRWILVKHLYSPFVCLSLTRDKSGISLRSMPDV